MGAFWLAVILFNVLEDVFAVSAARRIDILDVDIEASLYTWFSQLLLAGAGALLLLIGWEQVDDTPWIRRQWFILGGLFLFLSADEAVALHERLIEPLRLALHTHGALAWAWVIPYGAAAAAGLIAAIPFLRNLPRETLVGFLVAAAIYLTGALGCEMAGSFLNDSHGAAYSRDQRSGERLYRAETIAEEGLEGLGVLIFLSCLMAHRARRAGAAQQPGAPIPVRGRNAARANRPGAARRAG